MEDIIIHKLFYKIYFLICFGFANALHSYTACCNKCSVLMIESKQGNAADLSNVNYDMDFRVCFYENKPVTV